MNRSNNFHAEVGSHEMAAGISARTLTMTVPARMLPNSRSERVIGLTSSSMMFSGNIALYGWTK